MLYVHKFDNLEDIDQFLGKLLPKFNKDERIPKAFYEVIIILISKPVQNKKTTDH